MVGRTAKLVIFDELARFEQTEGKRGAWMVYTSLSRATATFGPHGRRVIISSPIRSDDLLMQLYEKDRRLPDAIVYKLPTWEMNPNIKFEDLKTELERDPIAFWRDFGCEPSESLAPYFTRLADVKWSETNWIPILLETNAYLPPQYDYVIAGDPAVKWDQFGIAIAHRDGDKYIIDGVYALKPEKGQEIDPEQVRRIFKRILERGRFIEAVFDIYMYPELRNWIMHQGIPVRTHIVRKQDYDDFKEQLYLGNIILPDYEPLKKEMRALTVKNERKIDHSRGGTKDIIDAVVNAYRLLKNHPKPRVFNAHLVEAW